ncbi:MAG: hypothetical protein HYX67_07095 [Candidatus Melainabacteria bacterium]|nr:hypothetical protein [Candidatus Melainabacteria bacterium]
MMLFERKPNLDEVSVAAPCPTSWESMEGDDRIRYCSLCSLNVYNLSGMTRKEGETLMKSATGPMCIRLYRRQDGTLITKDCPVGRRIADACKRRLRAIAMALFACIQAAPALSQECKDKLGAIATDTKTSTLEGENDNTEERRATVRAGVAFPPNNKWRTTNLSEEQSARPDTHLTARFGIAANVWHKEKVQNPRAYSETESGHSIPSNAGTQSPREKDDLVLN